MKVKLAYTMLLALAVVVLSTGCKHKPYGVTPLPGEAGPAVPNENPGGTLPGGGGVGSAPIPPMAYNPDNFNHDTSALAAYAIHFKFDSAVIPDSEQGKLQSVAQQLQSNPNDQLLIQGNCDERGTEEYNRSLGERRALAAREALAKLGIDPSRVHEISFGKDQPADAGHDEEAWSKNRRDDFVLLIPKMGA